MARFSGKGDRKSKMLTIQATDARGDPFFKRSFKIFKKVIELWTLCALENVFVVLFLGGKAFYIGNPPVYTLKTCRQPYFDEIDLEIDMEKGTLLRCIKKASDKLKKDKAKSIVIEKLKKASIENERQGLNPYKLPNDLSIEEFAIVEEMVLECMAKVWKRQKELGIEVATSTPISGGESNDSLDGSSKNDSSGDDGHEH
ncbi:hypothetical protein Gogos_022059 [Gossypium gossypioides]|uniref:MADS-box domain-containing protein n=1 Tax=Gossypium gossypioides TaxID=34282 RepID=A0A7J9D7I1_GOSGO|nr:hypothetical protein [Gossypium gossypioides]